MRSTIVLRILMTLTLGLGLYSGTACGQSWIALIPDSWFVPGNWNGNFFPTQNHHPSISNGGTAKIMQAGAVSSGFSIAYNGSSSTGTLEISGAGSVLSTFGNSESYVGREGHGIMNILAGGKYNSYRVGLGPFSSTTSGTVTVDGEGSLWTNSQEIYVGRLGFGDLSILNGGEIKSNFIFFGLLAGSIGEGVVDASKLNTTGTTGQIGIGAAGAGTLDIKNGSTVRSASGYISNSAAAAPSTVTVSGNSTWTNDTFFLVGRSGHGTLNIQTGGTVRNVDGYMGMFAGARGTANITGEGSKWTNTGLLYVGGNANPGVGDNATLNVSDSGMVTIGTTLKVWNKGLVNQLDEGQVIVTNDTSAGLLPTAGGFYVDAGTVDVVGGGDINSTAGYIGRRIGSTGIVNITGANSKWTNSGSLEIGGTNGGTGKLNVSSSAEVTVGTSLNVKYDGEINQTGDARVIASSDTSTVQTQGGFYVGTGAGVGTAEIFGGGNINSTSGYIGRDSNSNGTMKVRASAKWKNSGELSVGFGGTGALEVSSSGTVESSHGFIGRSAGSDGEVTVKDNDSTKWMVNGELTVGNSGKGTLNIQTSASVENTNGYVGRLAGSNGTVNVVGAHWKNNGELLVGGQGTGALNVSGSGTVNVTTSMNVLKNGTVTLDGPVGQLSPASVETDFLRVLSDGVLRGTGKIAAPLVANDGTIELDANQRQTLSADVLPREDYANYNANLVINGDFRSTGRISVTGLGQSDVLQPATTHSTAMVVSGTATLDGKLSVAFEPGYTPDIGSRFAIVSANEIVGKVATFESAILPGADPQHPIEDRFLGLNYRRSTFNGSEPVLEVVTLKAPRRLSADPPPGTSPRNLLLVTHGTRDSAESEPGQPESWVTQLARTMASSQQAVNIGDWEVVAFDWSDFNGGDTDPFAKGITPIGTFDPTGAANNAISIGESLVRWYQASPNNRTFDKVHLLAHSAGTWLIDGIADALEGGPDENIHMTLFEAFTPSYGIWGSGRVMADHADFADHYIHRSTEVLYTDEQLLHAVNIDLTDLRPVAGPVESHSYPYFAYLAAAATPNDPSNGGFGPRLAPLFSGGFPAYDSRMTKGSLFTFFHPLAARFRHVVQDIDFLHQTNIITGNIELLPNGNGILRTQSPAILTSLIELEQPFRAFEFDFEFLSDNPGLLSVYFGEEQVFEFESTGLGPGPGDVLSSGWIWLGEEHAPGPYSVTFRLDPLGNNQTAIEISNLSFISLVEEVLGDYNEDQIVDAADYVMWRKLGLTQEEYNAWRTNFGRTSGSGAGSSSLATVPEPAAFAMLLIGAAIFSLSLRKRVA